jgi:hypothetical protein
LKIASPSEVTFDSDPLSIPTESESLRREIESSVLPDLEVCLPCHFCPPLTHFNVLPSHSIQN